MGITDIFKSISNSTRETDFYGDDGYEENYDDNTYEDYDDDAGYADDQPVRRSAFSAFRSVGHSKSSNADNVVDIHRGETQSGSNPRIVLAKPVTFDESTSIADHIKNGHLVILNLETTSRDVAHKIVNFLSGVSYAKDGKLTLASANTFVISPKGFDVDGDMLENIHNGFYMM